MRSCNPLYFLSTVQAGPNIPTVAAPTEYEFRKVFNRQNANGIQVIARATVSGYYESCTRGAGGTTGLRSVQTVSPSQSEYVPCTYQVGIVWLFQTSRKGLGQREKIDRPPPSSPLTLNPWIVLQLCSTPPVVQRLTLTARKGGRIFFLLPTMIKLE